MTINPFILHGEELTPVRKLLALKALAGGAPLSEYTETGNPVSFETNVAKPMSVLAAFTPVQSGSGDPSPENVRPITGWSGASVTRCGKNLLNPAETQDGIWYNGAHYGSGYARYTASGYIRVEAGKKYVGTGRDSSQNQYCFFDIEKQYVSQIFASGSNPVTIPSGVYYMTTQFVKSEAEKMIEEGETATTFEEYTGNTVSVTFPAEAGTVYGGTLDLSTGVLTVDYGYIASYNGETIPGEWISDRDVYAEGTTPTTGAEVVYVLATPLVYQLTPTEILSLNGNNVLWSDLNGNLTVVYKKKG